VLVAPGGKNLSFRRYGGEVQAVIGEPEMNQLYIPSMDVMFTSASDVFGADLLGVVLTGMGNDGAGGAVSIKAGGGKVLAESEESSVVFGMPKEAIATGRVDKVLPLSLLPYEILRRCGFC